MNKPWSRRGKMTAEDKETTGVALGYAFKLFVRL